MLIILVKILKLISLFNLCEMQYGIQNIYKKIDIIVYLLVLLTSHYIFKILIVS